MSAKSKPFYNLCDSCKPCDKCKPHGPLCECGFNCIVQTEYVMRYNACQFCKYSPCRCVFYVCTYCKSNPCICVQIVELDYDSCRCRPCECSKNKCDCSDCAKKQDMFFSHSKYSKSDTSKYKFCNRFVCECPCNRSNCFGCHI